MIAQTKRWLLSTLVLVLVLSVRSPVRAANEVLRTFEENIPAFDAAIKATLAKQAIGADLWKVRLPEGRLVLNYLDEVVVELAKPDDDRGIKGRILSSEQKSLHGEIQDLLARQTDPTLTDIYRIMALIGSAVRNDLKEFDLRAPLGETMRGNTIVRLARTHEPYPVVLPVLDWLPFERLNVLLAKKIHVISLTDLIHDASHVGEHLSSDEAFFNYLRSNFNLPANRSLRDQIRDDQWRVYLSYREHMASVESRWDSPLPFTAFVKTTELAWWFLNYDGALLAGETALWDHPWKLLKAVGALKLRLGGGVNSVPTKENVWRAIEAKVAQHLLHLPESIPVANREVTRESWGLSDKRDIVAMLDLVKRETMNWLPTGLATVELAEKTGLDRNWLIDPCLWLWGKFRGATL